MQTNIKILFITSCCFSKSESNGKTLESLFSFLPKASVSQFYVKNFEPDWDFCDNYFRVTDRDMIKCFYKKSGGIISERKTIVARENSVANPPKKDAFKLIVRQFLWSLGVWKKRSKYYQWVDGIKPGIVFYMVGENSFMIKLAEATADYCKAPLVVFNTEGYYFANQNYFPSSTILGKITFPLFLSKYKKAYKSLMEKTDFVFYSCPKLEKDYHKEFNNKSTVLYTASNINVPDYESINKPENLRISYIGTLDLGRYESLMEIGESLYQYNPSLRLNVFGRSVDEVADKLRSAVGIEYHGPIPYSQVVCEIAQSDILIHVESFKPIYTDMIRYGFTTKIADSLMSGRCFFVYAPEYVACYEYIKDIDTRCVASSKEEMFEKLCELVHNAELRKTIASKNKQVGIRNHSSSANNQKCADILNNIINK